MSQLRQQYYKLASVEEKHFISRIYTGGNPNSGSSAMNVNASGERIDFYINPAANEILNVNKMWIIVNAIAGSGTVMDYSTLTAGIVINGVEFYYMKNSNFVPIF